MNSSSPIWQRVLSALTALSVFAFTSVLHGEITPSGDVSPGVDDEYWTTLPAGGWIEIGFREDGTAATGSLTIDGGSFLDTYYGGIGVSDNSAGSVLLTGAGSEWTSSIIQLGNGTGHGSITLSDGALLTADNLGIGSSALNGVELDGGVIDVETLSATPDQFTGTGVINARQILAEGHQFTFDDPLTTTSTTLIDNGRSDAITLNFTPLANAYIYSPMTVSSGVDLAIGGFTVGEYEGDTAVTTVTGSGSVLTANVAWTRIGDNGDGTLVIADGGEVNIQGNTSMFVGAEGGSNGRVQFDSGTLNVSRLYADADELIGTGVVNAISLVGDGYNFVFDGTTTAQDIYTSADGGQITVNLNADVPGTSGPLGVDMTVQNGGHASGVSVSLGYYADTDNTVLVTGTGSQLTTDNALVVGREGQADVRVEAGGSVASKTTTIAETDSASGSVTVSGPGSSWSATNGLIVGKSGEAAMEVSDGAALASGSLTVAQDASSTGILRVTGDGSRLTTGSVIVGGQGTGSLSLENGANAASGNVTLGIGGTAHGDLLIDGDGSTWTSTGDLAISQGSAIGVLEVTGGGRASFAGDATLTNDASGTAMLTIDGATSLVEIGGNLTLGSGNASIQMNDGGILRVGRTLSSSHNIIGAISLEGGILETSQINLDAGVFSGYGTIRTTGIVGSGYDLVFDGNHVAVLTMPGASGGDLTLEVTADPSADYDDPGNRNDFSGNITVKNGAQIGSYTAVIGNGEADTATSLVTGTDTSWQVASTLVVGYSSDGELTVADGAGVSAGIAYVGILENGSLTVKSGAYLTTSDDFTLGHSVGSSGALTLDNGSLNVGNDLVAGNAGDGIMNILNGAKVTVTGRTQIANRTTAAEITGELNIRGADSTLNSAEQVSVGSNLKSAGTLTISDGGRLMAGKDVVVNSKGTINLFVDGDALIQTGLSDGTSGFENHGTTNLVAAAGLAAGNYTPIAIPDGTVLIDDGVINAIGGAFNSETGVFAVSEITTDTSGPLGGKRVQYDDGLVVSFMDGTGPITFSVTEIEPGTIYEETVLGAYHFDTDLDGVSTVLTFILDDGWESEELSFWYLADGAATWTSFNSSLAVVDGNYASLQVTNFSSYAVTPFTAVPEPSAWVLIIVAGVFLLVFRRRRDQNRLRSRLT